MHSTSSSKGFHQLKRGVWMLGTHPFTIRRRRASAECPEVDLTESEEFSK